MTFHRPVIGPKVYLSRGPSGHVETFKRQHADRELDLFLTGITKSIALGGFIRKMALERRPDSWEDVLVYLADLKATDQSHVTLEIGISFWAHVIMEREAQKRTQHAHNEGN